MLIETIGRALTSLSGTANPEPWFVSWVNGGEPSSSGEYINEENALRCPAVKAAVSVLAETIGMLSIEIYRVNKSGRKERAGDHPVQNLLDREPNPETGAYVWKHAVQGHLGTYGNGYAVIQRTMRGEPYALWQRSPKPERTKPVRNGSDGKIYYQIRNEQGSDEELIPARDMLHIPYFSRDGIVGKSPIRLIREAIGGNKGAERLANEMFKNGGVAEGNFTIPGKLSDKAYGRLKEDIAKESEHGNRHSRRILEEGTKFESNQHDPAKMQMIEVRRFLIEEIARAYRITPHLLQDLTHATFSNVTELGRQFIVFTMMPWLSLWVSEINRKLLKPPYYCRFNTDVFMQGDHVARIAFYRGMFGIGGYSVNDIMAKEGENPLDLPGADEHFVPMNMIPLSKALEARPKAEPAAPGAPPVGDGITPAEPSPASESQSAPNAEALAAAEEVLQDVLRRMERIEVNAANRAARDPATFLTTLDTFYPKHTATMRDALRLPLRAVLAARGESHIDGNLESELCNTINEHVAGKRASLLSAAECKSGELPGRVAACVAAWGQSDHDGTT